MDYSTFSDLKYMRTDTIGDDASLYEKQDRMPEDYKTWKYDTKMLGSLVRAFGKYYFMIGVFELANIGLTFLRPALLE